jgi:SAM-dependent methyltransferase
VTESAGSSISRYELDIPDWPGLGAGLELTLLSERPGHEPEVLGTWKFEGAAPGPVSVEVDWLDASEGAVKITAEDGREAPSLTGATRRPEAVVHPEMVLRIAGGGQALDTPVKVTDTRAVEQYYQGEEHQDEYVVQHPFFTSFHNARMEMLGRIFRDSIPLGGKVLDVGSGYSIFFLITQHWDFDMTCCDLDAAAMDKMREILPRWEWLVCDALHLPFEDCAFDAVYAGEIIEHVEDVQAALAEWRRVLKPGGTFIMTTPNRDRLLAVANRAVMPTHPEHIAEMNLGQARANLVAAGFEVTDVTGIYLEMFLNWNAPPGKRGDMLVARFTSESDERYYKPLMRAGSLMPKRAFDLVFTCKRQ